MAKSKSFGVDVDESQVGKVDEFRSSERPGFADGIEWLFETSVRILLIIVTPWKWFAHANEDHFAPPRPSLTWRVVNAVEILGSWFGGLFSFLFDSVELFFINIIATLRRFLGRDS